MARISNVLFVALLVAVAAAMVAAAPPVTKAKISKATTAEKMNEIKLATTSKASSQALQEADNATATEDADDDSESDEPDGVLDDPDDAGKQGFFKNIIGGSSPMDGMGGGDHHPSKDIPALVWALPIVGFIGVGIAIAAYCSFGT